MPIRFQGPLRRRTAVALAAGALVAAVSFAGLVNRPPDEVTLASGTLVHHALTNDLFHIDDIWMKVAPDTEFHRWLSQGIGHKASIVLTTSPAPADDEKNARFLSGHLIHNTAPEETPILHILYLQDPLTKSFGPITFQTDDGATARKFDVYDESNATIVIRIS